MKKILYTLLAAFFVFGALGNTYAQRGGHHNDRRDKDEWNRHEDRYEKHYKKDKHYKNYDKQYRDNRYAYKNNHYNKHNYYAKKYNKHHRYDRRRVVVPWGHAHRYGYNRPVYFPSYRLYYDPARRGYTYRHGNRWLFSSALPAIFANINLGAANMTYIKTVPQAYYPQYNGYYAPAPRAGLNIHIDL